MALGRLAVCDQVAEGGREVAEAVLDPLPGGGDAREEDRLPGDVVVVPQAWSAAGVKVTFVKAPEATLIDRYIIKKDLPAYSTDTASPVPPDGAVLLFFHLTGGFLNGVNYSSPAWDKAFAASLATNDPNVRKSVFEGM